MLVKLTRHVERTVPPPHHLLHQHSLDDAAAAAAAAVLLNAVNTSKNSLLRFSTFYKSIFKVVFFIRRMLRSISGQ